MSIQVESKKCTRCKQVLPIDNFAIATKDGYRRGKCKPCQLEYKHRSKGTWEKYLKEKAYRKELHILQEQGKRRCKLCDEIKVLDEFNFWKNPKTFYNRRTNCKKCGYDVWRVPYRQTARAKELKYESDKRYNKKHRVKINTQRLKKYHTNPQHKLRVNMRNRLGQMLRNDNIIKTTSVLDLLGADIDFVKEYLESLWKEGMSWENWSKYGWHIDHIIPLAHFDLTQIEEQKKAFHYTNLQPLWAKENLSKQDKILCQFK